MSVYYIHKGESHGVLHLNGLSTDIFRIYPLSTTYQRIRVHGHIVHYEFSRGCRARKRARKLFIASGALSLKQTLRPGGPESGGT